MSATHTYDARGRLAGISEGTLGMFSFGYDPAGRPSSLTRPNGVVTTTSYDDASRATGIETFDGLGGLVHQLLTTRDVRGLPDTQTDQEGVHDYDHDARGRLTAVDHPAGAAFSDEAYTYDEENRRTSTHRDPAMEIVFNDADQLVQDAEYTYAYDPEGRRTSRTHRVTAEVTTYGYNALDQMTSLVEGPDTWTFVFDAMDLRVLVRSEDALGFETYGEAFVYDLRKTVRGSYDTAGVRTASYVAGTGFGEVLAMIDGSGVESYGLRDRLGTTVGWVDGGGGLSFTVRDAYGVRGIAPAGVVPFGYTGHAEDPTGLVWGRARCMAPTTGAWTSEDRDWRESRYGYVRGRSINATDPTGRTTAIQYTLMVGTVSMCVVTAFAYQEAESNASMAAYYRSLAEQAGAGSLHSRVVGGAWRRQAEAHDFASAAALQRADSYGGACLAGIFLFLVP